MSKCSTRLLLLFALTLLFVCISVPALAGSASVRIVEDDTITVYPGDTITISCSHDISGASLAVFGWATRNPEVVDITGSWSGSSRSTTLTALKPGTATIVCQLTYMYTTTRQAPWWNLATKKWESYKYSANTNYFADYTVTIVVADTEPPVITSQPNSAGFARGATASVSVAANDDSNLTYQWYYKDPGESSYHASSTGSTFKFTMNEETSGRRVYCLVRDANGNATESDRAVLSMMGISKQPSDVYRKNGETVSTSVTAYGEGLSYVWYYRDVGDSFWNKSNITTAKCSFKMTTAKDERQICCRITDKYGNSIESKTVSVNIEDYVAITQQPKQAVTEPGNSVTLSVRATGDGLKYVWYYKDVGASSYKKSSITTPDCTIKMTEAKSGRQVYCLVTDQYGNSVKSKVVTVATLAITKQPTDSWATTANTSVKVTGDGLKYVWYYRNAGTTTWQKSNITTARCTFAMTPAKDEREIYCKITDKYGNSVTSKTVKVHYPEYATITTQPKNTYAAAGGTINLSVKATGDGLKYRWYYKDVGDSSFKASSLTTPSISFGMTAAKSGRQIYCVVTDRYGKSVQSRTISIGRLEITKQPTNATGSKATTSVTAKGDGLKYVWYYKDVGSSTWKKSNITTATCTVSMTPAKNGRQIYCKITDKYGNSINSKTVTLSMLVITQQPRNAFGGTASTTVKATSDGLTYQWYYKDTTMSSFAKSDVRSATYSATMSESSHLRQVYCVITDQYGNTATSDTATLYHLEITQQPKDVITGRSANVTISCEAAGEGLTYTWYRGLLTDYPDGGIYTRNVSSFQRKLIDGDEQDFYYCIVTDKYGNSVRSDSIRIYFFRIYYPSPTSLQKSIAALSSTYKMILNVESVEGLELTYEWYETDSNGVFQPISDEYDITSLSGATYNYSYIILQKKNLTPRTYKCVVTDSYGHTKTVTWAFVE